MHRKSFLTLIFSALLVFAVIASQGCGGSSSSSPSGSNGGNGSVVVGGDTILDNYVFDTNGNGKPDFFDFDDVSIVPFPQSSSPSSINVPQVPSMIFFKELKEFYVDEPDTVYVNLEAGTEYTFEFSQNLTSPLETVFPSLEILDPVSKEPVKYFTDDIDDASTFELPYDRIQMSVYPEEKPSLVCLTLKPSVTGEYTLRISGVYKNTEETDDEIDDEEPSEDKTEEFYNMIVEAIGQEEADYLDSTYGDGPSSDPSPAQEPDKSCILFIYKELRNERGETGYYTRFKFADDYGNLTETIDLADIIQMRKIYLELRPDYLKKFYSETGYEGEPEELTDEEYTALCVWLYAMQEYNGLYGLHEEDTSVIDEDVEVSSASTVRSAASKPAANNKPAAKKPATNLKSNRSRIPTTISGIPYDDTYKLGNGFFGITGYQAPGRAIQDFNLAVPKTKKVSSNYRAEFISSQQEQENFSKTTASGSFSTGGFGLKASMSHMNSYKFGLSSTTLVIHYDELENTPRMLASSKYKLNQAATTQLAQGIDNFRTVYGDYFVSGYTYGGTYDAYISITTESTEQLTEIKAKLTAEYQSLNKKGAKASAEVANETRDILKKYNASISIKIITSGSSASDPNMKSITPSKGSNSVDSVGDVISELMKFRSTLAKQSPSNYAPVNVVLTRYSELSTVMAQINKEKNDGTIPLAPSISTLIQRFNGTLVNLGGYYEVVGGLDNAKIDAEVRDGFYTRYTELVTKITADPHFYDSKSKITETEKAMKKLSSELKALGDRYVFYNMLIAEQKREKEMYTKYHADVETGSSENVKYQPFGGDGGGSTGYKEFFVSAAVTNDIKAGVNVTLDGNEDYKAAGWRYWGTSDHNMSNVEASYTAKTATGGTDAAFCYVYVHAGTVDRDCHRRFSNYPVVGKSSLDFDFVSGYSRYATWTVEYQTMNFTKEKYPFFGLER